MTEDGNSYLTRREWVLWLDAHGHVHELANAQVAKAEASMERRLESMNEFRQSLRDQSGTFITRDVSEARHAAILDRIEQVDKRVDLQERWQSGIDGRTIGAAAAVSLVITVLGLGLAVVAKLV